jgi:hypothetical protein
MRISLIFLLFAQSLWAFNESQLAEVYEVHQKVIEKEEFKQNRLSLARFDLQLGMSVSGDIGIVSAGLGSAVELIWQKNKKGEHEGDDIDEQEIEVDYTTSEEELYQSMKYSIEKATKLEVVKPKIRRKVIRKLKKDAVRISRIIKNLVTMPAVGPWYIGGFFKNYHFAVDGSLLSMVSIGYSKRVRFRFKIKTMPIRQARPEELTLGQKKMKTMMKRFEKLRNYQKQNSFNLKRVWAIHEMGASLNLAVASFSHARGVQIEYKRNEDFNDFTRVNQEGVRFHVPGVLNNLILDAFAYRDFNDDEDNLSLHQVRIKYSANTELDFQIVSLEKESTLEYHYKR